jgi:DNA-binding beta-propeller fold protein YncE
MSCGEPGNGPGQLQTPHSIAADNQGNIYVADRGNRRIQVFDGEGKLLRMIGFADVPFDPSIKSPIGNTPTAAAIAAFGNPTPPGTPPKNGAMLPGAPWAVCITPGPNQVLFAADAWPGRVYKLSLDGKVLGVLGRAGKQPKEFGWIHEIACPSENEIYVAELLNWRAQKLILEPTK